MSIKFSVVREDPVVERLVIEQTNAQNVLMVASGGCTALSLKTLFPEIQFTLFDLNQEQIELVQQKRLALQEREISKLKNVFNIGRDNSEGLNGKGEFESLFRSFRSFIYEFVLSKSLMEDLFKSLENKNSSIEKLFHHKYWNVAFELYFSDVLLVTMFGKDAVQHATPGSYPNYFRSVIENGLRQPDYQTNYFLQHILLGYYLDHPSSWPLYLQHPSLLKEFEYVHGTVFNVPDLGKYQVISVSNIFDWMSRDAVREWLTFLSEKMARGAYVVFRQLNNTNDYGVDSWNFESCHALAQEALRLDKSLFYNQINILRKN